MEHFIVSARKYRPTHFKDVVGQEAITNTLESAIEKNHLAQALLFTGPRGVGKTTCARILAKKINQDGSENENEDFAFNIFELDAASNNSVDDIRNLIDQVRIPPQVGNYKVYIIDEVHMLSSAAFNAFLKTLEEPPNHAIFILATTEKHKIIPTILSRCQIFDFRRISVKDTKNHLANVAKSEGVEAADDALHIIAQKADGALRDALSIFDRVVSFSGKKLTREAVTENLNVLDYSYYFEITDLLIENKIPDLLILFNAILSKGFDGHHFIMGLASHFRDLLVSKTPETIQLLEVGEQVKKMYLEQSRKTSPTFLVTCIDQANNCDLKYKTSRNQRLLVELCLMQMASITFDSEITKKKKNKSNNHEINSLSIIPPAYFKKNNVNTKDQENEEVLVSKKTTPAAINKETKIDQNFTKQIKEEKTKIELSIDRSHKKSAFSIASIKKKKELLKIINDNKPDEAEKPKNSFTEKEFQSAWSEFTKKIDGEGKYNLLSHLTMSKPLLEGTSINLVYPNHTIKTEVERAQHDILSFIKDKLQNYDINLAITVNETAEKKYAYTPIEKYEKLIEKNPLLDTLRKELGLEL
ncbi:MAG: DNA polymerase III subunit gamma/tau [Flavobacteriaceae bacterium]|nr:DNA polymerase III subunit gamma/tau [Flavobacteriaceae bacterium]MDG1790813.1 DNA polymerase III subunit gamma/tau [Flavobacteriaceae bacterium]MDG2447758.1 DNA polymerase III subunit gamma/tau [Flavobacteriaceae bacterium]